MNSEIENRQNEEMEVLQSIHEDLKFDFDKNFGIILIPAESPRPIKINLF